MAAWAATMEVRTGKLRAIAHCGSQTLSETLDMAHYCVALGYETIAVMAPSFFRPENDDEVR